MTRNIDSILVLTETTFRERDYERFGIATLSERFNVQVLDCTPLLQPAFWEQYAGLRHACAGYLPIGSQSALEDVVGAYKGRAVAIDYLFTGATHDRIRATLRRHDILRTVLFCGLLPDGRLKGYAALRKMAREVRDSFQRGHAGLRCILSPRLPLPSRVADIAVVSGRQALAYPKACTPWRIDAHSFDYDTYLQLRDTPVEPGLPYALFLDQNLVDHSDRLVAGSKSHVITAGGYYPAMNRFLTDFEARSGLPVIVAAHPRAGYAPGASPYAPRQVVSGQTARLVQGARMVITHYSTAVSFSVLWGKPLLLLTTDELRRSWLQPYVEVFQRSLERPLLNVNDYDISEVARDQWYEIAKSAYTAYSEMYIKMPGSPERPLWDIFIDAIADRSD